MIEVILERMNRDGNLRPGVSFRLLHRLLQIPTLGFIGNLLKNTGRRTLQHKLRSATWLLTACEMSSALLSVKDGLSILS